MTQAGISILAPGYALYTAIASIATNVFHSASSETLPVPIEKWSVRFPGRTGPITWRISTQFSHTPPSPHRGLLISQKRASGTSASSQPASELRRQALALVPLPSSLFRPVSPDTTDTVLRGTPANKGNYRNCSRRTDSLVTR